MAAGGRGGRPRGGRPSMRMDPRERDLRAREATAQILDRHVRRQQLKDFYETYPAKYDTFAPGQN